ncbi:MAG: hypothetical protein HOW73_09140 [Polyangiaceae bacterium]|nr:hypothetical protein [Polyangiaceae bacterium]
MTMLWTVQARGTERTALIHTEDVTSLLARANARSCFPELGFSDPDAEELLSRLEIETTSVDDWKLRCALLTTMAIDGVARHFFERHPEGIAVALQPGLCSRFCRIDNGLLHWIDVDPPSVAGLKCAVMPTPSRHVVVSACSLACCKWLDAISTAVDAPLLFIQQGSSRTADQFPFLLDQLVRKAPAGTEFVLDYDARLPLRPSRALSRGACLELLDGDGCAARYPRMRFVSENEYSEPLKWELDGLNALSRLFDGREVPSIAHLRFT